MTLVDNSIEQWCRNTGGEFGGRKVSLFQFARPAVVARVRDQMIFMPPVEADRVESWEEVMRVSRRERKVSARERRLVSNSLRDWRSEAVFLAGEEEEKEEEGGLLVVVGRGGRGGGGGGGGGLEGKSCFAGECWSFQSSTNSWDQNMSVDGRWGVLGMRGSLVGDTRPFGRGAGAGLGGVDGGEDPGSSVGVEIVNGIDCGGGRGMLSRRSRKNLSSRFFALAFFDWEELTDELEFRAGFALPCDSAAGAFLGGGPRSNSLSSSEPCSV